ncbi:MAG: TlpA disulfide reductase family protein [Candidatus Sumerlaeia bacterium]
MALMMAGCCLMAVTARAAESPTANATGPAQAARTPQIKRASRPTSNTVQIGLIGKPAPEFVKIKGWSNSTTITLESLRGKVVMLDFFFHKCPPCIRDMPKMMDVYERNKNQGLVVIGVHSDIVKDIPTMESFLQKNATEKWGGRAIPWPIALDGGGVVKLEGMRMTTAGATCAEYGVYVYPTKVLIDKKGIVREFIKSVDPEPSIQKLLKE